MNRNTPRNRNRLGMLPELAGDDLVEAGQLKGEGKGHGRGREEKVARDVEFDGDIEGVSTEVVDDEGSKMGFSDEGLEEVAKERKRASNRESDDGLDFGVFGEIVEGDEREEERLDGGREVGEESFLGFGRRGVGGNGDGDG